MRIINAPVPCLEASKLLGPKARPFFKRLARRNTRHALLRWVKAEVDSVMREREEEHQTATFIRNFLQANPSGCELKAPSVKVFRSRAMAKAGVFDCLERA
jgi:hypothetical protein